MTIIRTDELQREERWESPIKGIKAAQPLATECGGQNYYEIPNALHFIDTAPPSSLFESIDVTDIMEGRRAAAHTTCPSKNSTRPGVPCRGLSANRPSCPLRPSPNEKTPSVVTTSVCADPVEWRAHCEWRNLLFLCGMRGNAVM